MLGKHDDVKPNLESNYTFAKSKEQKKKFVFEIWKFQKWHCVEHKLFHAQTNLNQKGDESFNPKPLEVEIFKTD